VSPAFLDEVLPRVREAVGSAAYDRGVPERAVRAPSSLRRAIEREREAGALLVEYKRASPGATRPLPPPRTVEEFVAATDVAGVAGYSCLATAYGFDGAPAHVAELAALTRRPVLFKEFVLTPRQVEVAARSGAAAVLLIARLETERRLDAPLSELARTAHRLGLEVLLELHAPAELSRVAGVEADVFGVNSRDLATLRFERETASETINRARELGLRPLLGLSGVEGPKGADGFWSRGCDGILVGSAVARSDAPDRFLSSLRRSPGGSGT
jgi:indole-3-glycerol phosphate synthase